MNKTKSQKIADICKTFTEAVVKACSANDSDKFEYRADNHHGYSVHITIEKNKD